jgi:uncharacterized protein (DUF983 family)
MTNTDLNPESPQPEDLKVVSPPTTVWTADSVPGEKRNAWSAIRRGLRGRCPRCGEGKLFRAFLKVDDHCSVCGQDFTPHRADDLPAYLVIVIVGHFVVPMILWIETDYAPSVPLQLAIYLPFTLIASLLLLQPVKGAVVGLQWAFRMHGFDENDPEYQDLMSKKKQREQNERDGAD